MADQTVPSNDYAFLAKAKLAHTVIVANLSAYHESATAMSDFGSGLATLEAALALHEVKTEAAKAQTELKDADRLPPEDFYRKLNVRLHNDSSVTDDLLVAAGFDPRNPSRNPVPPPSAAPIVVIEALGNLKHEIRFLVPGKPRGGKLPGTAYYALYYKLGPTPPAGIADCVRGDNYSKSRGEVTFTEADAGKTVWYIAVPHNAKGQGGPESEAVAATIAA